MTDEQIKQKAEAYVSNLILSEQEEENYELTFIDGAHSRDEEIKELQNELESLRKGFYERGDKLKKLMLENNKLRNPWISVEERLPEEGKDILLSYDNGIIVRLGCVGIGDINFIKKHIQRYVCWMETPKPKLKKGE